MSLDGPRHWLRSHPLVVDVAAAAVLAVGLGGWSIFVLAAAPPVAILAIPLLVVPHAAIALRRRYPLASFLAVSAGCAALTELVAVAVLPSTAVFLLSLYSACAYGRRIGPALGLVVGATGAALVALRFPFANAGLPPALMLGFLLAVVLVAWSLGLFRRVQLAYVAALEERAARAEAEREERARIAVLDERARIAREMHDVVAHTLSVIVSQARGGRYDPTRAAEVLARIEEAGRGALTDMRGLLGVLRPDDEADGRRPQPTLAELGLLIDRVRGSGLTVTRTDTGGPRRLRPAAELAVYRLVQEALTNAIKHSGPGASAQVALDWGEQGLTVTVTDDGRGPGQDDGRGHGLLGMRERLAAVGGSVATGPGPDGGFQVRAHLPEDPA